MKKFVFLHIPRTAGGSLNRIFRETNTEFYQRNDTFIGDDKINVDIDVARKYDVISGHILYDRIKHLKRPKITFLRDPIERVISQWYYLRKHDRLERQFGYNINIVSFIQKTTNLLYRYTGGNLSNFAYIGFQETATKDYEKLSEIFEFPLPKDYREYRVHLTTTGKYINDRLRSLIRQYNKKDEILYQNAKNSSHHM